MSELLVSVRSADEARLAARFAAWIDVKEPRRGSLGRADEAAWVAVASVLPPTASLTIALGGEGDPIPAASAIPASVVAVKLAPRRSVTDWRQARQRWEAAAGRPLPWVTVLHADDPDLHADLLAAGGEDGDRFVLVDTRDKSRGSSLSLLGRDGLERIVTQADGRRVAIAGRLSVDDLRHLADWPVILGVRSAACGGDRTGQLDPDALAECVAAVRA